MSIAALIACLSHNTSAVNLPNPDFDLAVTSEQPSAAEDRSLVLAGGCFWGIQAVFQHVKGVKQAISGYAGGTGEASYQTVSSGTTNYAESVKVIYDPKQVSFGQILKIFFAVAHDPTQLNRQGPDHGSQYRSAIFFETPEQEKVASSYIAQLNKAKVFSAPIVTTLEPLNVFYEAESYHQNYAQNHPDNPYIMINDAPKVAALKKVFPTYYLKD